MRLGKFALLVVLSLCSLSAIADYEIYLMVCEGGECKYVINAFLESDGRKAEYRSNGITLKVDTLAAKLDEAEIRVSAEISPNDLGLNESGRKYPSKISFTVEPRALKQEQYSAIGNVSDGSNVYQLWGRLRVASNPLSKIALR